MNPNLRFEDVYQKFNKMIYQIVFRIIKDRFLAEDIMQETFLKAYKKMDTIEDQSKLKAWLFSIATRTAIDFVRKEKRLRETIVEDLEIRNLVGGSNRDSMVENEMNLIFFKRDIQNHIHLLPSKQREVFLLKIQHGLKVHEIAEILKLKPATVKTWIYRSRKELKLILSSEKSA